MRRRRRGRRAPRRPRARGGAAAPASRRTSRPWRGSRARAGPAAASVARPGPAPGAAPAAAARAARSSAAWRARRPSAAAAGRRTGPARPARPAAGSPGVSASGSSSSTWTGDGRSAISDWYGGSGGISPPWPRSGSVSSGSVSGPMVVSASRSRCAGTWSAPAGAARRVVEQPPQRAALVEVGQRPQQPARDRVARERRAGASAPRSIAARCRSTAWSLIRLAGLVRHVSSDSAGVGKPVDRGARRQHGRPRRRRRAPTRRAAAGRSGRARSSA